MTFSYIFLFGQKGNLETFRILQHLPFLPSFFTSFTYATNVMTLILPLSEERSICISYFWIFDYYIHTCFYYYKLKNPKMAKLKHQVNKIACSKNLLCL